MLSQASHRGSPRPSTRDLADRPPMVPETMRPAQAFHNRNGEEHYAPVWGKPRAQCLAKKARHRIVYKLCYVLCKKGRERDCIYVFVYRMMDKISMEKDNTN